MKIFKIISVLLICMSLFIASGCGKAESIKTIPEGNEPQKIEDQVEQPTQASSNEGGNSADSASTSSQQPEQILQEGFETTDSDNIQGWKTLHAAVSLMRLGEENSYQAPSADDVDKDKKLKYSIDFPGDWTLEYTVFYDIDNKKVAELPPAILLKPGQEAAFLDYKVATDFGEELISREGIQFNSYKGGKTVTKIPTESGSWYPHIYRISDGTYGCTINLYSKEINKEDQELFDRIVNTFRIEQ
jgi:hypothetical protein